MEAVEKEDGRCVFYVLLLVLMYILLLLELGFFPLFLFSWEKKKKD